MAFEVTLKYNDGRVQVFDDVQKVRVIDGNEILFRCDNTTVGAAPGSPAIVDELAAVKLPEIINILAREKEVDCPNCEDLKPGGVVKFKYRNGFRACTICGRRIDGLMHITTLVNAEL